VANTLGLATHEQVFTVLQSVVVEDMQGMMSFLEEVFSLGNIQAFLKEIVYVLCYLLTFDAQAEDGETAEFRQQVGDLRLHLSNERALLFIKIITQTLKDNRGMGLELATRIAFLSMLTEVQREDRISALEEEIKLLKSQLVNCVSGVAPGTSNSDVAVESMSNMENIKTDAVVSVTDASLSSPNESSVDYGNIPELPWPEDMPAGSSFSDGFEAIPDEDMVSIPVGMSDASSMEKSEKVPSMMAEPVTEGTDFSIPGGTLHTKADTTSPVGEAQFTLPGGTVHLKEENTSQSDVKEAPVTGGFSNAGFGDTFSGGLFGSTGASYFGW